MLGRGKPSEHADSEQNGGADLRPSWRGHDSADDASPSNDGEHAPHARHLIHTPPKRP